MYANKKILMSDIRYACSDTFLKRGKQYYAEGKVLSLDISNEETSQIELDAVVQWSGGRQYKQDIAIIWQHNFSSVDIEGYCSCPVQYNCKHVAAVCFAYMEQVKNGAGQADSQCISWLDELENHSQITDFSKDFLAYVIESMSNGEHQIKLYSTREKKQGGLIKGRAVTVSSVRFGYAHTSHIQAIDIEIAKILSALQDRFNEVFVLTGSAGNVALEKALHTGRLFWQTYQSQPLQPGLPIDIQFSWKQLPNGNFKLLAALEQDVVMLSTEPPVYVNITQGTLGKLKTDELSPALLSKVIIMPEVPAKWVDEFSQRLVVNHPSVAIPPPKPITITEINGVIPVPQLRLFGYDMDYGEYGHFLRLRFDYQAFSISAYKLDPYSVVKTEKDYCKIYRATEQEMIFVGELAANRFHPIDLDGMQELILMDTAKKSVMERAAHWSEFIDNTLPQLENKGWIIEWDDSFKLQFQQATQWDAEIEPSANDWFEMSFNIMIDDQSMPLLPLLASILENYALDDMPKMLSIPIESHRYINIPSSQLKPFLNVLTELYDSMDFDEHGKERVSRFNAAALADLEQHSYGLFSIKGGADLIETGKNYATLPV
jgi:SWIM zinc finger